ncbi:MAG: hypothetical protein KAG96_01230 [Ichthyobacteriaceae bacterium]|nr:hypothetical protein [Ichthyobacteriaceae bacterium]
MDLISLHSNWSLAVILLLLISIVNSIFRIITKGGFGISDKKFSRYALISVIIQVGLGIYSYLNSVITKMAMKDFGGAMKNSDLRLYAVEHPSTVVLAVVSIVYGFIKTKTAENDNAKHKNIVIFYTIGLVLILLRMPY